MPVGVLFSSYMLFSIEQNKFVWKS